MLTVATKPWIHGCKAPRVDDVLLRRISGGRAEPNKHFLLPDIREINLVREDGILGSLALQFAHSHLEDAERSDVIDPDKQLTTIVEAIRDISSDKGDEAFDIDTDMVIVRVKDFRIHGSVEFDGEGMGQRRGRLIRRGEAEPRALHAREIFRGGDDKSKAIALLRRHGEREGSDEGRRAMVFTETDRGGEKQGTNRVRLRARDEEMRF